MPDEPINLDPSGATSAGPGKLLTMLVAANFAVTLIVVVLFVLRIGPFNLAPPPAEDEMPAELAEAELPPPIYESMDKPIVANFKAGSRERYLQLVIQFMTRSEKTVLDIRKHMPAIIDGTYRELGTIRFEELQTNEGREALRQSVLNITRDVLERYTGEPGVDEVFFTTYVFQ